MLGNEKSSGHSSVRVLKNLLVNVLLYLSLTRRDCDPVPQKVGKKVPTNDEGPSSVLTHDHKSQRVFFDYRSFVFPIPVTRHSDFTQKGGCWNDGLLNSRSRTKMVHTNVLNKDGTSYVISVLSSVPVAR